MKEKNQVRNLPIDFDTMKLINGIFRDAPLWYHVKIKFRKGKKPIMKIKERGKKQ